jgi:lipoprotein-anchoring transpeptidase ErfK/SrfK
MEVRMKRSRRRFSRGLALVLGLAIAVSAVFILRKSFHGTVSSSRQAIPTLSVLDVGSGSTAQTRPSVAIAQPLPSAVTVVPDASPVIQTSTPNPLNATAAPPAPPTTRPAVASAPGTSWNQLLNNGSADGASAPTVSALKGGPIVTGNGPLADGKARLAAGQILDARAVLNDALQSGRLNNADAEAAKSLLGQANQSAIFGPRVVAGDAYCGTYLVRSGDSLARIAANYQTTWALLARINQIDPRRLRFGTTIKVIRGPFFAVVNKSSYTMDMYLGALPGGSTALTTGGKGPMFVCSFPVGLGKDDSTPVGLWAIGPHAKLLHPTYYPPEGGQPIEADDPANPLGGYWIGLTGVDGQAVGRTSYGIHGTIDPNSIGHQASMGCIRLRSNDIALVFDMLVEGKSMVLVKP